MEYFNSYTPTHSQTHTYSLLMILCGQIFVELTSSFWRNITLTTWDEHFLCDEQWAQEFQLYTDEVNCHEMTHSYFGDSVVIRHFEHVWLKVLFTTTQFEIVSFHFWSWHIPLTNFTIRWMLCLFFFSNWLCLLLWRNHGPLIWSPVGLRVREVLRSLGILSKVLRVFEWSSSEKMRLLNWIFLFFKN